MIKNKNGTTFKLQSPNPIMKEQLVWDNWKIHNFDLQEETIKNSNSIEKFKSDFNKLTNPQPVIAIEEKSEQVPDVKPTRINTPTNSEKILTYCLPATINETTDELYDETKITINYGNAFKFETILVDQQDLLMFVWTNVQLTPESILYLANTDKRWWKVNATEEKENGYLVTCIPSELTPHFHGV